MLLCLCHSLLPYLMWSNIRVFNLILKFSMFLRILSFRTYYFIYVINVSKEIYLLKFSSFVLFHIFVIFESSPSSSTPAWLSRLAEMRLLHDLCYWNFPPWIFLCSLAMRKGSLLLLSWLVLFFNHNIETEKFSPPCQIVTWLHG